MTRERYKYLVLLFLMILQMDSKAQSEPSNELKILSWNIQMLPNSLSVFSKALRKKQAIRKPWIIDYLIELAPDVICLQEVFDRNITCQLKKELKTMFPYQIDPKKEKGRLTSSGLLILSKRPIREVGYVTYSDAMNEDKWAAKGCVMVTLDSIPVFIANTHLQAGGGAKGAEIRVRQYEDIRNLIDAHVPKEASYVLVGDMNTRKKNETYYPRMLSILDLEDAGIDDPRPFTIDSTNTWNNHAQGIQLDYVLHRLNSMVLEKERVNIIRPKKKHKGTWIDLADHYGLLVTYMLKKE